VSFGKEAEIKVE